jgi:hypothetical protein
MRVKPIISLSQFAEWFSPQSICIDIWGGLGNQLFAYTAGVYFSLNHNRPLIVNMSTAKKGINLHGGDISNLNLPYGKISKIDSLSKSFRIQSLTCRFARRFQLYFLIRYLTFYVSPAFGYDKGLEHAKRARRMRGYFQSYFYIEKIEEKHPNFLKNISLQSTSDAYVEYCHLFKQDNYCAIHFRRGDYSKRSQTIGLLGKNYYLNGIKYHSNLKRSIRFVVFSDDIDAAENFFGTGFENMDIEIFKPKSFLSPEETLFLLSNFENIIIGNSTFSWWAATLGSPDKQVVAPKIWFYALEQPEKLIKSDWIVFQPDWTSNIFLE